MAAVGFVGLGRMGSQIAALMLDAGHPVVLSRRGRVDDLLARGARVAGDGSPRAVAESADVVFTCLPAGALGSVFLGADGLLSAAGTAPIVVDLSTASITDKESARRALAARGGALLDCPVSGTPAMVAARSSVLYASGDRPTYDKVAELLRVISPGVTHVGEFGTGTKLKFVANLLVLVHMTAAAESMAFATSLGLDLDQVVELVSRSPAATSGQFAVRAPMIAAGRFDGDLVTVEDAREVLDHITQAAAEVGASTPMATTAKRLLDEFGDQGENGSDPGKLTLLLRAGTATAERSTPPSTSVDGHDQPLVDQVAHRVEKMLGKRLYVGISTVVPDGPPLPIEVIHDHLEWVQELERAGTLFAAGPFVDEEGSIVGDGLFILRAESAAEAAGVLAGDPIHLGGYRRCTVRGWSLHQGTINVSVTLSDRTYTFD